MSVKYIYQDGAANQYHIQDSVIKYEPVTAKFSSSGSYDGGPAWEANLEEKDFLLALEKLEALILATHLHIDKRIMGSGRIIRKYRTNKNMDSWLIRKCPEKSSFEDFLQSLKA